MKHGNRVTIQRVADVAGVSIATVSRVLSGLPGAGVSTRERVLRVAAELDYRSDPHAKALRSGKSGVYGMVVPDLRNPFFPELIHTAEDSAQKIGRELFIANAQNDPKAEQRRVEALIHRRVDALIISPVDRRASTATVRWAADRVPVIQLDRRAGDFTPYVGADQAHAVEQVIEHLHSVGRTRIGFVGFPDSTSTSKERIDAFLTLRRAEPNVDSHIWTGTPAAAAEASARWIAENPGTLDALIASSDLHGISVKSELQRRTIRVPDDIALVAFDNTFLAAAADMTSVQQPGTQMAERAIELIESDDVVGETIIRADHIVPRGSSTAR